MTTDENAGGNQCVAQTTTGSFMWACAYLGLSGLSGMIELGVLIMAARRESLLDIPLFALAYQVGAALSHPIRLPRIAYAVAGVLACVCAVVGGGSAAFQAAAIIGTSTILQHVREVIGRRCHVTTFWKRVARVGGFVAAPWLGSWGIATAALGLLGIWAVVGPATNRAKRAWPSLDVLGVTMAVHQSHYFLYSCFLPLVFIRTQAVPLALIGLAFALGWTSYCWAPWLFRRWRPERAFVFGHCVVVAALVMMIWWIASPTVVLLAWFISGFGGGTVFCLRDLERRRHPAREGHMDAWENIGHVIGAGAGIVIVSTLGNVAAAFEIAAGAALCTAFLGVAIAWCGTQVTVPSNK